MDAGTAPCAEPIVDAWKRTSLRHQRETDSARFAGFLTRPACDAVEREAARTDLSLQCPQASLIDIQCAGGTSVSTRRTERACTALWIELHTTMGICDENIFRTGFNTLPAAFTDVLESLFG